MKARYLVAAMLAVTLAVAASTASGGTNKAQAYEARGLAAERRAERMAGGRRPATKAFKAQHPGRRRRRPVPDRGATHLTKFDAALAGGDAPDVIELGNSEMTKYMAAGAFKTLTQSAFPNNKTWLEGLKASCMYNGQALRRAVLRRARAP